MIGKKNIVFGFLYLVLTAGLGPYMVVNHLPAAGQAQAAAQEKLQALRDAVDMKTAGGELAEKGAEATLALANAEAARQPIDAIKGGPHTHGNLEALLNIAVGLLLAFLAVPVILKQIISWIFIAGALLHSGILYLVVFKVGLAQAWLMSPAGSLGPALILVGLLLAGIAAAMGYKGTIQK